MLWRIYGAGSWPAMRYGTAVEGIDFSIGGFYNEPNCAAFCSLLPSVLQHWDQACSFLFPACTMW